MKMKCFSLHHIRRLSMLLLMVVGVQVLAFAADVRQLTSRSDANNMLLENGFIYTISQNVTIQATACNSALKVADYGAVTLYIPRGLTLTVNGGNGNGRFSGGAGIYVPSTSKLIITGEGTLNVRGGNAGNGGNGGNGGNAWLNQGTEHGAGGQGGMGGYGGGGAAAAIGGAGGNGHDVQYGPNGLDKRCEKDSYDFDGYTGYNTIKGDNGVTMGNVYVMGTVTVNANAGSPSYSSGGAGNWGNSVNDKGSGWTYYYTSGSGGPGGGGGSGYGAQYGIGGGAPGAQCGATGASGGTYSKTGSWAYNVGGSGAGGKGTNWGSQNNNTPGRRNGTSGGYRSNEDGSHGGHGRLYSMSSKQIGGRNPDYAYDNAAMGSVVPGWLYVTLKFENGNNTSDKIDDMKALYGVALKSVKAPKRSGYHFLGFYDQKVGGNQIYDANGNPLSVSLFSEATTLYAQWTASCAQNTTTKKMYTECVEDAINEASVGDCIFLYANQESVHLNKAVTLDLGGMTIDTLYVERIPTSTAYVTNGTVKTIMSSPGHTALYDGRLELSDITVDKLYADGHTVIINSGRYGKVINQSPGVSTAGLSSVTIKGEDTFVESVNSEDGWASGNVQIVGGWYTSNPESEETNVVVPGYAKVVQGTAPSGAPSDAYCYAVVLRNDFVNTVHFNNNYVDTKIKATEDLVVDCSFMLNTMQGGTYIPIFGSTDAAPKDAHGGFGLYVNTADRSFVFATGTEFFSSPAKMVEVGRRYYVTLGNSEIRIDTVKNAANDYYHKAVTMFKLRDNGKSITIGHVNGSDYDQCDMTLYQFALSKGEDKVMSLVPAFGLQNTATDICLYDEVGSKTYYDAAGLQLDGEVGVCNQHPQYRIGAGLVGKRTCVICGQQEEPDAFLEYSGIIANYFGFSDLTSASRYRVHYADSEEPYLERTVTSASLMELENIKLFSLDVVEGTTVKHHLTPITSCDKYFLCDSVTGVYHRVNEACNANFEKSSAHTYDEEPIAEGYTKKVCHGCGYNNGLDLAGVMSLDLGVLLDDDDDVITIKMRNKSAYDYDIFDSSSWPAGRLHAVGVYLYATLNSKKGTKEVGALYYDEDATIILGNYTSLRSEISELLTYNKHEYGNYGYGCKDRNTTYIGVDDDLFTECYVNNRLTFGGSSTSSDKSFILYEVKVTNNGQTKHHFVPSIYEGKAGLLDINTMTFVRDSYGNTSTKYCGIEPCDEHVYLDATPIVTDGKYYRRCCICNELAEDTRNFIRTNGTSYLNTDVVPSPDIKVDIKFVINNLQPDTYILGASGIEQQDEFNMLDMNSYRMMVNENGKIDFYSRSKDVEANKFYRFAMSGDSVYLYNSASATQYVWASSCGMQSLDAIMTPIFVGAGNYYDMNEGKSIPYKNSDISIYGLDIYACNERIRSYTPSSQNGVLGFYESFENRFYPMEGEGATSNYTSCSNHIFCDYALDSETGKWMRHCRLCGVEEEVVDEPFVTNNGGATFDTGLDVTADTRIVAHTVLNKFETNKCVEWPIRTEVGGNICIGDDLDNDGLPVNFNIYNVAVYEGEGNLTHYYMPSIWNGVPSLYDVNTDTHILPSSETAPSAYVPECQYHRYFQLETSSDENGQHIYRHCKICDAMTQLSGISVASEDTLRHHVYADNGLTLHLDLVSETYEESYVDTKYPALTDQDIVCGIAVMNEGKLQEYFLPAIRKAEDGSIISGMYNAVRNTFVEVPGSMVAISDCEHTYSTNDYVDGKILSHCYLCDEVFGAAQGYYMDITYDANGGKGVMGKQRITTLDDGDEKTLRANGFTYGAHYFAGWEVRNGEDVTIVQPGDYINILNNTQNNVTLYAHWNDGFICNGDTLEVNSENTADIRILDDGEHGFETTGTFQATKITYERPLDDESATWGTLCLPFETSTTSDLQLYNIAGITKVKNLGKYVTALRLAPADNVEAGKPCIFEITQPLDANTLIIKADNVDVKPTLQVSNSSDTSLDKIMLVGSYEYLTFPIDKDDTYYAIQGNAFYSVGKGRALTVRPYHAYLEVPTSDNDAREQIYLWKGGDATGISTFSVDEGDAQWYTVDGKRVSQPQRGGVYILKRQNGKSEKVLIR